MFYKNIINFFNKEANFKKSWYFCLIIFFIFKFVSLVINKYPLTMQDEVMFYDYGRVFLDKDTNSAVTWSLVNKKPYQLFSYLGCSLYYLSGKLILDQYSSRTFILLTALLFYFVLYKLVNLLVNNKIYVFLISLFSLLLPLNILPFECVRLDHFCISFFLISIIFLIKYRKNNNSYYFYLSAFLASLSIFIYIRTINLFPIYLFIFFTDSNYKFCNKIYYNIKKIIIFTVCALFAFLILSIPYLLKSNINEFFSIYFKTDKQSFNFIKNLLHLSHQYFNNLNGILLFIVTLILIISSFLNKKNCKVGLILLFVCFISSLMSVLVVIPNNYTTLYLYIYSLLYLCIFYKNKTNRFITISVNLIIIFSILVSFYIFSKGFYHSFKYGEVSYKNKFTEVVKEIDQINNKKPKNIFIEEYLLYFYLLKGGYKVSFYKFFGDKDIINAKFILDKHGDCYLIGQESHSKFIKELNLYFKTKNDLNYYEIKVKNNNYYFYLKQSFVK